MWATSRPAIPPSSAPAAPAICTGARSRRSATRAKRSARAEGAAAERRAAWHYRLRGYRVLAANVWAGGNELDLVVRRGGRLVFVEVKAKADGRFGDPVEMVGPEKARRVRRAAEAWLASHPELAELDVAFEVVAVRGSRLARVPAS